MAVRYEGYSLPAAFATRRCLNLVHCSVSSVTGSPEAVARLRFPQNVACGFPALRSSAGVSQHCKSLQLRIGEAQLWFQ